jgi:acetylornithine deacetylase/succinyl-diaminopimelate desuccinylase-like protein
MPVRKRASLVFFLLFLVGCGFALASDIYPVDWSRVRAETLDHYTHLLRIDTTNPPGNETKAANYVKLVLDREGIPGQLFSLDPARANVVARLKGNGSKKPILVMGHTDTVGVQREKWSVDPFAALRKDGFI